RLTLLPSPRPRPRWPIYVGSIVGCMAAGALVGMAFTPRPSARPSIVRPSSLPISSFSSVGIQRTPPPEPAPVSYVLPTPPPAALVPHEFPLVWPSPVAQRRLAQADPLPPPILLYRTPAFVDGPAPAQHSAAYYYEQAQAAALRLLT